MPHILITDDDPHLRRLVRTYAELEGFECTEAGDGAAAVTALKQSTFDLVLLDVMMPGPDGFETLEAIRGFSQVPVIMLTARNEEYDKLNGFRLGVDDYVAKPFSPKELMARIGARAAPHPGPYNSTRHKGAGLWRTFHFPGFPDRHIRRKKDHSATQGI